MNVSGSQLRFALAAFATGLTGLFLTYAGADIANLQVITAAQPGRAMWIFVFAVNLLIVPAALRLSANGAFNFIYARLLLVFLLLALATMKVMPAMILAAAPICMVVALLVCIFRHATWTGGSIGRISIAATFAVSGAWLGVCLFFVALTVSSSNALDASAALSVARAWVLPIGGLILLWITLGESLHGPLRPVGWLCGIALALAAIESFDKRSPWQRFIETPLADNDPLRTFVPRDSNVYWDGGLEIIWLRLQQASYFSCTQGTGVGFFRATALLFADRTLSFQFQIFEHDCFEWMQIGQTLPTRLDLVRACAREPALDHVILSTRIEGLTPAATFYIPIGRIVPGPSRKSQPAGYVFRYDCALIRASSATAEPDR
jgi:hypothetical protein